MDITLDGLQEPNVDFLSSIILFGIIQGIILFFVFFLRRPKGYIFFLVFLGSLIIQELEAFLFYSGYMFYLLHFLYLSSAFSLLSGPALMQYTFRFLGLDNKKSPRNLLHFLPAILYFLYNCLYIIQPLEKKYFDYVKLIDPQAMLPLPRKIVEIDPLEIHGYVYVELIGLHLVLYGAISLFKIYKQKKNVAKVNQLVWLVILNGSLMCSGLVLLIAEGGVTEGIRLYYSVLPKYSTRIYNTFSLYFISAFLLLNGNFFRQQAKYQKSSLNGKIRKAKLQKIITILETEKPFLKQSFSLTELSQQCNMPRSHITEVINQELKMTFYELTNDLRIKEGMKLLQNPDQDLNMEQFAFQLGYNSKSAFYRAFKKVTSMTPLQYKTSHKK